MKIGYLWLLIYVRVHRRVSINPFCILFFSSSISLSLFPLPFFPLSSSSSKNQTTDISGSTGIPRSIGFNFYRKVSVPNCKSGIILILFNVSNSSDPKSVSPTIVLTFLSLFFLKSILYLLLSLIRNLYYIG